MKTIGIYKITNISNGKCYIGQSTNILYRFKQHKLSINFKKKENLHLYNAFLKYGIKKFNFEILFVCNRQDLDSHEIYFIDFYKTCDRSYGYNIEHGGSKKSKSISDETREKMSIARIGKPLSLETREKMAGKVPWNKNQKNGYSEETLLKMSKAKIGYIPWIKGKHHSEEIKLKMALSKSIGILQYDQHNNFIREWISGREIARDTGYNRPSIYKACKNNVKYKGYFWRYKQ